MKSPKKTRSFRIDESTEAAIKAKGLDINEVFNAAMDKAAKTGKCPYCGK